MENIDKLMNSHDNSNVLCVKDRIKVLKKLKDNIKIHEKDVLKALKKDLNKSYEESFMTEIGIVYNAITYMCKNLKKFAKVKKVVTPLSNYKAKSYIYPAPYGKVLVISPWNYPFLLAFEPVIDALAAGNNVILKPSEYSPNTSDIVKVIISETFNDGLVDVILGGIDVSSYLLKQDFDYIFFTGSGKVGQIVLESAAKHFTPVTLELGGKSPCIVDESANLPLAARRIVFGKLLNAGQTCIAPDYIYCHESIKDELLQYLKEEIIKQYGENIFNNENYPKIINEKRFNCLLSYIDKDKILYGGNYNKEKLLIEPTILKSNFNDNVMQDEIFGPILPIITFNNIDEVISNINKYDKPLALYIFSTLKSNQDKVLNSCQFGGGCINDTIMHISNHNLPFGGIKHSGMGSYHGKNGFDTFTHYKSVLKKSNIIDVKLRYQPISKIKYKIIKMFLK